jgi:hypothetical protein
MPVVQGTFFIPDDIATGLATGLYRRIGSVVRYAVGPNKCRFVKHLDPIDLKSAEEAHGLGVKALQFVKEHKKETIITFAVAATVGIGANVCNKLKSREPKVVAEFRVALRVYIDAIREGNMDVEKIDKLMAALEELKKYKNYEKISIQLTTEDLETLVGRIYDYTVKLAKDNDVELAEDELRASRSKSTGTIINLQNYLKAQKRIFEETA